MCGISGIVNFYKKPNTSVANMISNEIIHRGPDSQNNWTNNFCSHNITRLSIVDLTINGEQPFLSKDRKVSIIYNGEIYNFLELKKKYFSNVKFKGSCDGEILIYLYEKFGIQFLDKVKGMFAISISDERKKKHFLIRDRFGIKPLNYHYDNKKKELTFCSEVQGLFLNNIKKRENIKEIYRYLKHDLLACNEETWFQNIYQLKPAHFIEISKNNFQIKKYYKIEDNINEDYSDTKLNTKKYQNILNNSLELSFKQHSTYDVKGGIFTSGGADSALLLSLSKNFNKKIDTFTFDFNEKKFSEIKEARNLAKKCNFDNLNAILPNKEILDYYLKVIEIQQEPISSLRVVSHHHLYEYFKNQAKVIFEGSGGDEISAGYRYQVLAWFLDMLNEKNFQNTNKEINSYLSNYKEKEKYLTGSLNRLLGLGGSTSDGSIYFDINFFNKDFLNYNNSNINILKPFKSHIRNSQYADLHYFKLPRSLKYADRASMRYGVETRLPFLDHELVENCIEMPTKLKFINQQQRYLFKNYIKKKIKNFKFENKRSIADPQQFWLKKEFKNYILDILSNKMNKSDDIFNYKYIKSFYNNFLKSKTHINSYFILSFINVVTWRERILKKIN